MPGAERGLAETAAEHQHDRQRGPIGVGQAEAEIERRGHRRGQQPLDRHPRRRQQGGPRRRLDARFGRGRLGAESHGRVQLIGRREHAPQRPDGAQHFVALQLIGERRGQDQLLWSRQGGAYHIVGRAGAVGDVVAHGGDRRRQLGANRLGRRILLVRIRCRLQQKGYRELQPVGGGTHGLEPGLPLGLLGRRGQRRRARSSTQPRHRLPQRARDGRLGAEFLRQPGQHGHERPPIIRQYPVQPVGRGRPQRRHPQQIGDRAPLDGGEHQPPALPTGRLDDGGDHRRDEQCQPRPVILGAETPDVEGDERRRDEQQLHDHRPRRQRAGADHRSDRDESDRQRGDPREIDQLARPGGRRQERQMGGGAQGHEHRERHGHVEAQPAIGGYPSRNAQRQGQTDMGDAGDLDVGRVLVPQGPPQRREQPRAHGQVSRRSGPAPGRAPFPPPEPRARTALRARGVRRPAWSSPPTRA